MNCLNFSKISTHTISVIHNISPKILSGNFQGDTTHVLYVNFTKYIVKVLGMFYLTFGVLILLYLTFTFHSALDWIHMKDTTYIGLVVVLVNFPGAMIKCSDVTTWLRKCLFWFTLCENMDRMAQVERPIVKKRRGAYRCLTFFILSFQASTIVHGMALLIFRIYIDNLFSLIRILTKGMPETS